MNKKLIHTTFVATLAGLLFGYDQGTISGALIPLAKCFMLSAAQEGYVTAVLLIACAVGALLAWPLCNLYGRRTALRVTAFIFIVSALWMALAPSYQQLLLARFLCGLAVGFSSLVAPMYIAEISPASHRGRLVVFQQIAIVLGLLITYSVNAFVAHIGSEQWVWQQGWRWMFGAAALPALFFFIFMFRMPRSPRWLVKKGLESEAKAVIKALDSRSCVDSVVDDIKLSLSQGQNRIWGSGFEHVLLLGIMIVTANQVTGINLFVYYATILIQKVNHSAFQSAISSTVVLGALNLTATIIAALIVDRIGRRQLLMGGLFFVVICLLVIGTSIYLNNTASWVLLFVFGFIFFYAISIGAMEWVLVSEIYPNSIRERAMSMTVTINWLESTLVAQTFPMMLAPHSYLEKQFHGAFPFWLYGGLTIIVICFFWRYLPETKLLSLEQLEKLWHQHPLKLKR